MSQQRLQHWNTPWQLRHIITDPIDQNTPYAISSIALIMGVLIIDQTDQDHYQLIALSLRGVCCKCFVCLSLNMMFLMIPDEWTSCCWSCAEWIKIEYKLVGDLHTLQTMNKKLSVQTLRMYKNIWRLWDKQMEKDMKLNKVWPSILFLSLWQPLSYARRLSRSSALSSAGSRSSFPWQDDKHIMLFNKLSVFTTEVDTNYIYSSVQSCLLSTGSCLFQKGL